MVEDKIILTSKEAIIGMNDLPLEAVFVKEWDVSVYMKPITLEERIKWEESIKPEDPALSGLTLLVYSICDEKGNPLFTEADIPHLRKRNAAAIMRLLRIARRISRMRDKDIEEEIKNSESIQPG